MNRTLECFVNGNPLAKGCKLHLQGKTEASLVPDFWLLEITDPPSGTAEALTGKPMIAVTGEDRSLLAEGRLSECQTRQEKDHTLLTLTFSDALPFWESTVSLTLSPGKTAEETAEALLAAASYSVPLGAFPVTDRVFTRAQSFHGRTADYLEQLARSLGARIFLSQSVLYVLRADGGSPVTLTEQDVTDPPSRASGATLVRTSMKGWPVGFTALLPTGEKGRVLCRGVDACNTDGPWSSYIILGEEEASRP